MTGHYLLHSFEPIDPMTASAGYLATSSAVNPPSCSARSCVASSTTRGMISSPSGWVAAAFTASYHRRAQRHHTHGVVAWGALLAAVVAEGESCLRREGKRGQRSLPRPVRRTVGQAGGQGARAREKKLVENGTHSSRSREKSELRRLRRCASRDRVGSHRSSSVARMPSVNFETLSLFSLPGTPARLHGLEEERPVARVTSLESFGGDARGVARIPSRCGRSLSSDRLRRVQVAAHSRGLRSQSVKSKDVSTEQ